MSLINQMLQDLDARRASGAELALVPRYVRALPRADRSRAPWWIAVAVAAIGLAGALGWHLAKEPPVAAAAVSIAYPQTPPSGAVADAAPPVATVPPLMAAPQVAAVPSSGAGPIPASAVIAREPVAQLPAPALPAPMATLPAPAKPAATGHSADVSPPPAKAARAAPKVQGSAAPAAGETAASAQIDKRAQQPSARELAESDFRDGTTLLHQGRLAEAQEKFRLALQYLPGHGGARQALFGLLLEARRLAEAEQVLQEGIRVNSAQPNLAMALARMQVDRGDTSGAIETLRGSAASAQGSADYVAFLAALLQRQGRHGEAVDHYQTALTLAPGSSLWSMGLGISLQALQRNAEARAAFRRAIAANSLSAELHAFVAQQLRQLQ